MTENNSEIDDVIMIPDTPPPARGQDFLVPVVPTESRVEATSTESSSSTGRMQLQSSELEESSIESNQPATSRPAHEQSVVLLSSESPGVSTRSSSRRQKHASAQELASTSNAISAGAPSTSHGLIETVSLAVGDGGGSHSGGSLVRARSVSAGDASTRPAKRRKHDPDCIVVDEEPSSEIQFISSTPGVPLENGSGEDIEFINATPATRPMPPPDPPAFPIPSFLFRDDGPTGNAVNSAIRHALTLGSSTGSAVHNALIDMAERRRFQFLMQGDILPRGPPPFRGDPNSTPEERMRQIQERHRQNAERILNNQEEQGQATTSTSAQGTSTLSSRENEETSNQGPSTTVSSSSSSKKSGSKKSGKGTTIAKAAEPAAQQPSSSGGSSSACPICMETYDAIKANPVPAKAKIITLNSCGHVLCNNCLDESYRAQGKLICPVCRKKYTKKQIRQIFF